MVTTPRRAIRSHGTLCFVLFALLLAAVIASPAFAGGGTFGAYLVFDTELTSLSLSGPPILMPLASDPTNDLGDSTEGYGWVSSAVSLTLSSQRMPTPGPASLGQAYAYPYAPSGAGAGAPIPDPPPIDPSEWDGETFQVSSFFDVFFDITVTDVDPRPGRDYPMMPDGASITFFDNGPANMQNSYEAIFDAGAPNFGLLPPPEAAPYFGHFNIEIPLGGDINGNGENDKIKFTLATHTVDEESRTFIILPDGTVVDSFDSLATLDGLVVDESTDPPFSIALSGPTTATSNLLNPIVPEPSSAVLLVLGGLLTAACRRGRRQY